MDIKKFGEKLEAERKTLTEELKGMGVVNKETGDWEAVPEVDKLNDREADDNDLADKYEDFESRSAKLAPLEAKLKDVNEALMKIKAGTYGVCVVCGEMIEEERLNANPSARTCIKHM